MAGHVRSVDTGKARRTAGGKSRKVREHLPPGEVEAAKRRKQHLGARTVATDRINRARDAQAQLDIAREYVRSAAAKYTADEEITAAVQALLAAGDRIFQTGQPLSPAGKRARREAADRHRVKRQQDALLLREGRASIRRQQADARRVS